MTSYNEGQTKSTEDYKWLRGMITAYNSPPVIIKNNKLIIFDSKRDEAYNYLIRLLSTPDLKIKNHDKVTDIINVILNNTKITEFSCRCAVRKIPECDADVNTCTVYQDVVYNRYLYVFDSHKSHTYIIL